MLRFIFKTEKQDILKQLEYYGITKLPYLMNISGKEKVRGYTGDFSNEEIVKFDQEVGIEIMGIYLFNYSGDDLRLSFDAVTLLKEQITKNIIELDEKQFSDWIRGNDLFLKDEFKDESLGFKVIKFGDDFFGVGKLVTGRLVNYVPKERRVK